MFDFLETPYHVLITEASLRRNRTEFVYHVWNGTLPKGSILKIEEDVYLSSPELCFAQMADGLSLIELIMLGFELCSIYTILDSNFKSMRARTTVPRLLSFAEKAHPFRSKRKALYALGHVIENSASPMESFLAILLTLPRKIGGYGLLKPLMNHRIDMRSRTKHQTVPDFYVCDLYWPQAQLAIEYDSDVFHTGSARIAHDSIRRNNLCLSGITILTVTRQQIMNSQEMDKIAVEIARRLGKRLRCFDQISRQNRLELRKSLLVLATLGKTIRKFST